MQNNLREIRKIIYRLKRSYGLRLTYYRPESQTHNVETGEISRVFRTIEIKRAILLPSKLDRSFVYDLTYIAANNNFVGGAYFDRNRRVIMLDGADVPRDFVPEIDDHLTFDSKRYEVLEVNATAQYRAFLLRVQAISNSEPVDP